MSCFKTFFTSLKLFILLSTSLALAENPKNIIAAKVNKHIITAQDVLDAVGRLPAKLKEKPLPDLYPNIINELIKKIGLESGLENAKMDNCLKDEEVQDQILNERIEAQKKYKIESTPTIYINEKKYEGEHQYKSFKKNLQKILKEYEI